MDVRFVPLELSRIDALRFEAVAFSFFADERPLRGGAGVCDWRLCGRISALLSDGRVTGARGEVTLFPARPRLPFDKALLFGLGVRAEFDRARYAETVAHMLDAIARLRLRTFVTALPGRGTASIGAAEAMQAFLEATSTRPDLDEVVILEDLDAQRAMVPIVEAERRRARAARGIE